MWKIFANSSSIFWRGIISTVSFTSRISPYMPTQDSQSMLLAICFVLYSFLTVSSSSTSSSVHFFFLDFFIFRVINYKLRLFTPRSSYGAKEMAPKSQLCACSFQDSLRQKNWALEQIRKFPDTIGYVWTAENDSNTLRVDAKIFASAKKYLRKKKFPDTCGHGLIPCFSKFLGNAKCFPLTG